MPVNRKLTPMSSGPNSNFTPQAAALWGSLPEERRRQLLSNVWCTKCRHGVTITNFTGTVKDGSVLLVGLCAECRSDVGTVVEGG